MRKEVTNLILFDFGFDFERAIKRVQKRFGKSVEEMNNDEKARYEKQLRQFDGKISDTSMWFLRKSIERTKVDVSYMSDDEYSRCMDETFNSLEYWKIPKEKLTGSKWMNKHMNVGDPIAQTAGVSYQIIIDNFITIVKGIPRYARYMDDSYVIHNNKKFLMNLLNEVYEIAKSIGVTINRAKTHIYKLSEYWRFLQIQYSLTDTGRIIRKINPKRLTAMRRKMKKIASKMTEKEFHDYYTSWMKAHCKYMSRTQRQNMDTLYEALKEETKCTQSH